MKREQLKKDLTVEQISKEDIEDISDESDTKDIDDGIEEFEEELL